MVKRVLRFRVLIIDDDEEMNAVLRGLLSGHQVMEAGFTVIPEIVVVAVGVEEIPDRPGYWRIAVDTLRALEHASSRGPFDLVIADYGYADKKAKEILWGKDRTRTPNKDEAKGRVFTIHDLAEQFALHQRSAGVRSCPSTNVFLSSRQVLLRSMAGRLAFDILGPVFPNRVNETRAAFPRADVDAVDPRNEFYGGDAFYHMYEHEDGREFYRQIVGAYTRRALDGHILRAIARRSGRPQVTKSVFNIAVFAGMVTLLGSATQYLGGKGVDLLSKDNPTGWWVLGIGLLVLGIGALGLSLYFEAFSRAVVRWVRPDQADRDD